MGARRVLVTGTGPLGCIPSQLAARSSDGECVPEIQEAADIFTSMLIQMTRDLNSQLGSDIFIAVNTNTVHAEFVTNPQAYGLFYSTLFFSSYFPDVLFFFFFFISFVDLGPCQTNLYNQNQF